MYKLALVCLFGAVFCHPQGGPEAAADADAADPQLQANREKIKAVAEFLKSPDHTAEEKKAKFMETLGELEGKDYKAEFESILAKAKEAVAGLTGDAKTFADGVVTQFTDGTLFNEESHEEMKSKFSALSEEAKGQLKAAGQPVVEQFKSVFGPIAPRHPNGPHGHHGPQ